MSQPSIRVRFINHACIQVIAPSFSLLTDPWFSGTVFNNSWRLLQTTAAEELDLSNLKYIWISHEHPDHLHFPTLKLLRKLAAGPLTVFFQKLSDPSVRDALAKLDFVVVELADGVAHEVVPGFTLRCFRAVGGDSALIVDAHGTLIANTNDCGLTERVLARMRAAIGRRGADVLLTQFGLAGYYANPEDAPGLARAREFHIAQLRRYVAALAPRYVVPFASFIHFCRPSNRYLNTEQVRLRDLMMAPLPCGEYLVPRPGSEVWPAPADPRTMTAENIPYWELAIDRANAEPPVPDPCADRAEIEHHARLFMTELPKSYFRRRLADTTTLYLADLHQAAVFDWKHGEFRMVPADDPPADAIGELGSGDFLFLLKFPWGADTVNITATFRVFDSEHWGWLVWTKHAMYAIKKAGWRPRMRNRLWLAAARATRYLGIDLADGNMGVWRLWDRLSGRRTLQ